eukprot:3711895-Lingulodinium_polyedra.AAC.1
MEAVWQDGFALLLAAELLRAEREVMLEAVWLLDIALQLAAEPLRAAGHALVLHLLGALPRRQTSRSCASAARAPCAHAAGAP